MMSYTAYKVIHLFGIFLTLLALGAIHGQSVSGGAKVSKLFRVAFGIGLAIIFVAGFGLLAKLGLASSPPPWLWGKLGIWALLGGSGFVVRRPGSLATGLWLAIPVLGALAAYLVLSQGV
jgi:hypothetical protein